jgi:2-oxoglutarate dehydrogenase E2 component (dihydrolipoamide succinyltransferase)
MAKIEVRLPKLGESVIEATITRWLKNEGDAVTEEESIVEIATDKVDTEIPTPVAGILLKKLVKEGDVVPVGGVLAIVSGEREEMHNAKEQETSVKVNDTEVKAPVKELQVETESRTTSPAGTRFYSPLVRSIALQENIPMKELEAIKGTGKEDRITKHDILDYLKDRNHPQKSEAPKPVSVTAGDQVVEMDRIRQLIATHMVKSVQTSPHVTSFMEADVTRIIRWRDEHKESFEQRENQKLTFTPVFIQAIAGSVRDIPMINVSVEGSKIIIHSSINVGMAVAMADSNLIVPVIKNADQKSLLGIIRNVNDLAHRARFGKLVPDEIAGGTISLTNFGSFGTLMGTPIINQPQAAIVAVGAIKKRPVVVETPEGDTIAIRQMMMISVTYDHRVIDGAMAGQFLIRLVHHLENFDTHQTL